LTAQPESASVARNESSSVDMSPQRPQVPRAVAEAVLKDFNHLCSICGKPRPQLHHIDEDSANNDPLNLLPLCPNHHLTDQHNPTSKIDPLILRLFRVHRDPTILTPQFQPLFRRLRFLEALESSETFEGIEQLAQDLWSFVGPMEMGEYYAAKIGELTTRLIENPLLDGALEVRNEITNLIVELLRYQPWRKDKHGSN
jgi:hypothetical protein